MSDKNKVGQAIDVCDIRLHALPNKSFPVPTAVTKKGKMEIRLVFVVV